MDSNLIRLSAPFTLTRTFTNKSRNSHFRLTTSISASRLSSHRGRRQFSFDPITGSGTRSEAAFDEAAFEAERLRLDAKARETMAETSKRENEDDPKAWKWVIRKRIWDLMEARNVAQNPRPVHHRIPNFVGSSTAAQKVKVLSFHVYVYFYFIC